MKLVVPGLLVGCGLLMGGCANKETFADTRREMDNQDAVIRELSRKNEELASRETVLQTEVETMRAEVTALRSAKAVQASMNDVNARLSRAEAYQTQLGQGLEEDLTTAALTEAGAGLMPAAPGTSATLVSELGLSADILSVYETIPRADGLAVRIDNVVLFESGSAQLRAEGKKVLRDVARRLQAASAPVRVEGHSDNTPIKRTKDRYPLGNLELSGKRALEVAHFLKSQGGIPDARVSYAGYGEHRPAYPNDTEANRARNRRVEIVLLRTVVAGGG